MSDPVSERSKVRDAIVAMLQDAAQCPNLIPLTKRDGDGAITVTSIIGWMQGDLSSLNDSMVAATGIAVIVIVSSGREEGAQELGVTLITPVTVMITEQVTTNRDSTNGGSGLPGDYVAEQVLAATKYWEVPGTGYIIVPAKNVPTIQDGTPFRSLFNKDAQSGFYTQIVNLETRTQIAPRATA